MSTSTAYTGTTQYPNRLCNGNLPGSQRIVQHTFDASCFAARPIYTSGNAGWNMITAPRLDIWDMAVHKDFPITERPGITFRAEFFNLLNEPNFEYPKNSIGTPSAGAITSLVTNARQIQFALRLHW